jgi:hypothetical protein
MWLPLVAGWVSTDGQVARPILVGMSERQLLAIVHTNAASSTQHIQATIHVSRAQNHQHLTRAFESSNHPSRFLADHSDALIILQEARAVSLQAYPSMMYPGDVGR